MSHVRDRPQDTSPPYAILQAGPGVTEPIYFGALFDHGHLPLLLPLSAMPYAGELIKAGDENCEHRENIDFAAKNTHTHSYVHVHQPWCSCWRCSGVHVHIKATRCDDSSVKQVGLSTK